ncbi:diguanylate cyclase domain-containing protein [Nostoc sp.]|uniref:diguanylate cyclase domain-containing protein n=1 Tax=Nostoc sp. TaxID=1180 RepID=UPI002FF78D5B
MNFDSYKENKGNILLVDDLPENLQLLSDSLIQLGYTVRSVTSGRMALKTVKVKQPDIILLDIKMPEMDGYQVCKTLKADEDLRTIPVVFVSTLDDVFDKVTAFELGGIDYITKPFQMEEVVARIENQLTIQRQQRLLEQENIKRRETEEILYQSRAMLASILNSSLDGIAAMQAVRNPASGDIEDFRCLVVNPVIARAFGSNHEEMIGKFTLKKFLTSFKPELFNHFVNLVETGKPIKRDFYHPLGNSCWYHFVAVKLGDGFAITIRDITGRKQIELAFKDANQKLEQLANVDGLTQVANRRCFNGRLQAEWKRLAREQQPLSLILFDVDKFKLYNDYYGHLAGDDCLIRIAQTVQQTVHHPADLVARYGGEEFSVLLPKTDLAGAIQVAQSIQQVIHAQAIPHAKSDVKNIVTLSLGITSLIPTWDVKPDTLIALADRAMYNAKQEGRDRYCTN